MSITRDALQELLAFLLPPACLACNRVEGTQSLCLGLCLRCHRTLETLQRSTASGVEIRTPALRGLLSRWSYEPPLDAVIHGLKFGKLEYLGQDLADDLHRLLRDATWEINVVVPIPLHWHRRLARGYNQAEAIARPLARILDLPMARMLRRRKLTRPQARLTRHQREKNLRLAFATRRFYRNRIAGQRILLVDDVVTTGATLQAAASCLENRGAKSIWAVTAGRTPGIRR